MLKCSDKEWRHQNVCSCFLTKQVTNYTWNYSHYFESCLFLNTFLRNGKLSTSLWKYNLVFSNKRKLSNKLHGKVCWNFIFVRCMVDKTYCQVINPLSWCVMHRLLRPNLLSKFQNNFFSFTDIHVYWYVCVCETQAWLFCWQSYCVMCTSGTSLTVCIFCTYF